MRSIQSVFFGNYTNINPILLIISIANSIFYRTITVIARTFVMNSFPHISIYFLFLFLSFLSLEPLILNNKTEIVSFLSFSVRIHFSTFANAQNMICNFQTINHILVIAFVPLSHLRCFVSIFFFLLCHINLIKTSKQMPYTISCSKIYVCDIFDGIKTCRKMCKCALARSPARSSVFEIRAFHLHEAANEKRFFKV